MSPTRRDVLKLSPGAVTAALATGTVGCRAIEPAFAAPAPIIPEGHIRKREAMCFPMGHDADDGTDNHTREAFHLFMDGDLDNTWTIWVTPHWRHEAITGERDGEGIIDCRELTGSELMSRVWQESHQVQPRILNAANGGGFMHRLAEQDEDWELRDAARKWWKRSGEWSMDPGDHTLAELNGKWWQLVLWNHPALDVVSGANAVIYYGQWFYLAQLDMDPVNIPGVA